jgi:flagella basal body P-ring formation protein FlgA
VTVHVSVDGRSVQAVPLGFRVERYAHVAVAARALDAKGALGAGDWRVERRPVSEIQPGALTSVPDASDLEPVRPIRAGEVLTAALLKPRLLVRRGDLVTLVLEGPGFRITTRGVAAGDARRGEAVRVLNPTSKREALGTVEVAGVVRVPFGERSGQ